MASPSKSAAQTSNSAVPKARPDGLCIMNRAFSAMTVVRPAKAITDAIEAAMPSAARPFLFHS